MPLPPNTTTPLDNITHGPGHTTVQNTTSEPIMRPKLPSIMESMRYFMVIKRRCTTWSTTVCIRPPNWYEQFYSAVGRRFSDSIDMY